MIFRLYGFSKNCAIIGTIFCTIQVQVLMGGHPNFCIDCVAPTEKRIKRQKENLWRQRKSQLRHTPIPQNFVALHGMDIGQCRNGREATQEWA
jgi:hypothetical protein